MAGPVLPTGKKVQGLRRGTQTDVANPYRTHFLNAQDSMNRLNS